MRFLSVNARNDAPVALTGPSLADELALLTRGLAPDAPIVILVHGFRYAPSSAVHSPHIKILSPEPNVYSGRGQSWPAALGLGSDKQCAGIGFGWEARGSLWQAYEQAEHAGRALARLVALLRYIHTGPIRIMAHSLGARVALSCFSHLPERAIDRMILMTGAAFRADAARALSTPAGQSVEVLNLTSQQNQVFDFMLERIMGRTPGSALRYGLPEGAETARWLDLGMDDSSILNGLANLGHPIAAPARHMCHWSLYLREGLFDLYRALLVRPRTLPLRSLRSLKQSSSPSAGDMPFLETNGTAFV